MTENTWDGIYKLHPGEKLIVMESSRYPDLEPHADRCDAAMTDLRQQVLDLRAEVAGLRDAVRSLEISQHKLSDAVHHVGEPGFTMPVDDWVLNE